MAKMNGSNSRFKIPQDEDPLCCCEYINTNGERSHLMALCCNCEDLDKMVDSFITGRGVDEGRFGRVLQVAEDRLRLPWPGGAIQPQIDKVLPVILVPAYILSCSLHPVILAILTLTLPFTLYTLARCLSKWRPRTKFFLWISYTSAIFLFYIYEVELVGLIIELPKIVSPIENIVLVTLTIASLVFLRRLNPPDGRKQKSSEKDLEGVECRYCERVVVGKDHHCVWLDVCISQANMRDFRLFLFTTSIASVHLAMMLSSAACPGLLYGPFLFPRLCWPDSYRSRIFYASGIYSGIVSLLTGLLFVEQITRRIRR